MAAGVKKIFFLLAAPCIALLAVWLLGEMSVRTIARYRPIYNIEMVKYAKELKMADPEGVNSHVHRPNAAARLMGVDIFLNSLGHRDKELAPKTAHVRRILVLGSSVTMGWGVPQEKVFTALVEKRIGDEKPFGGSPVIQFANAGIGNYDTLAQLNLFKRQYRQIRPDAVILHYFISDAEPRRKGSNSRVLRHSYMAAYFYDRARLAFMKTDKRDLVRYYSDLYRGQDSAWSRTRGYVAEMSAITSKDRVPFIVMIVPDIHNLRPDTPYAGIYATIEAGFGEMGIKTLNTFPDFQSRFGRNEKDLWIQSDDPHPNARGHALMAEALYRFLVAENPLSLPRRRTR